MKFYGPEDLTDENFEKFCKEIEEISIAADNANRVLNEMQEPKFNTIEDARKYYNSTPFEEWVNQIISEYNVE